MSLPITVSEPITHPKLWRFTGFVSSIVGFSCYALSPSFKDLFGKWNPLKIAIYTVFTVLILLLMLFVNKWKGLARTFLLKAHVGFLILMLTSLYSFFEDRSEETNKEKAYESILSLISCGAFALMSISLARQLELGFEVGMFNFFLGGFLVTVMKMNFKLAPVAAIFCYLLVNFRSCSNCLLKILGRADVESGSSEEANRIHASKKTDDNNDEIPKRWRQSILPISNDASVFARQSFRDLLKDASASVHQSIRALLKDATASAPSFHIKNASGSGLVPMAAHLKDTSASDSALVPMSALRDVPLPIVGPVLGPAFFFDSESESD